MEGLTRSFREKTDPSLLIRRLGICANDTDGGNLGCQLDMFTDCLRENALQRAVTGIRKRYGMNAIVKGMNLEQGATTIQRNTQIGGHRAGSALPDAVPEQVPPENG